MAELQAWQPLFPQLFRRVTSVTDRFLHNCQHCVRQMHTVMQHSKVRSDVVDSSSCAFDDGMVLVCERAHRTLKHVAVLLNSAGSARQESDEACSKA